MFETSKDLLNLVLAFAVLWITVFICWSTYYLISTLRNIKKITVNARKKIEIVDEILDLIKEKLEKGSNHMGMMADSVIKMVGFFMDKNKKEPKKKTTRKKKSTSKKK